MTRKPCKECPFARSTPPGATGGAEPEVYVGQGVGPFFLPCHMDPNYEKDKRSPELLQCAGAAVFRANTGVARLMPPALLQLPPDRQAVFATPAELVAHHGKVSLKEAEKHMRQTPPGELLMREYKKAGVQVLDVPVKKP